MSWRPVWACESDDDGKNEEERFGVGRMEGNRGFRVRLGLGWWNECSANINGGYGLHFLSLNPYYNSQLAQYRHQEPTTNKT